MIRNILLVTFLFGLCALSYCRADIIIDCNDVKYEGKVTIEGDFYVIKQKNGIIERVRRGDVKDIIRSKTGEELLKEKLAKADQTSAASLVTVGKWAKRYAAENSDEMMEKEAIKLFQKALDIDPKNAEANDEMESQKRKVEKKCFDTAVAAMNSKSFVRAGKLFNEFVKTYPESIFVEKANSYLKNIPKYQFTALEEEVNKKKKTDVLGAKDMVNKYLKDNPESEFKSSAEKLLTELDEQASQNAAAAAEAAKVRKEEIENKYKDRINKALNDANQMRDEAIKILNECMASYRATKPQTILGKLKKAENSLRSCEKKYKDIRLMDVKKIMQEQIDKAITDVGEQIYKFYYESATICYDYMIYNDAKSYVNMALKRNPDSLDARNLLTNIQNAMNMGAVYGGAAGGAGNHLLK